MTLDEEYQKAIDDQRAHLLDLQAKFNDVCEGAKKNAQEKIKGLPEDDRAGREAALKEQKGVLDDALAKLKVAVGESTRHTMKQLEEIVRRKEEQVLKDLEAQLLTA